MNGFLLEILDRPLKLKDGRFCLSREVIERGGTEAARTAFEQFYTDKGQQRFEARAVFFAPKVGVTIAGIKVKMARRKSRSASKKTPSGFHRLRWLNSLIKIPIRSVFI